MEPVKGMVIENRGTGVHDGLMRATSGTETIANQTPTTPWIDAAMNVTIKAATRATMDTGKSWGQVVLQQTRLQYLTDG